MKTCLLSFLALMICGCSSGSDGPTLYHLSGIVTYKGVPLEAGEIRFAPDSESGNEGTGLVVPIVDGFYETPEGKGVTGGAYIAVLKGMTKVGDTTQSDGPPRGAETLFSGHKVKLDLPKADHEQNFDVPE